MKQRRPHRRRIPITVITAEIDWEINGVRDDAEEAEQPFGLDWKDQIRVVDLVAEVLARYKGQVIADHEAFCVQPLPHRKRRTGTGKGESG